MQAGYQKYDISQCALYKCTSKKRLMKLLQIHDDEYYGINEVIKYHSFQIDKKNSSDKRNITAPDYRIKEIQRRILRLLQKLERPEWLISGEKGKCYIDNGKAHLNSNYVLTVDISQFYDNCKREYVFSFFKNRLKMVGDLAGLCTDVVTYAGGIPTGCPTSQIIAYYAYENMFFQIFDTAQKSGCKFTLYVDDMTFSSEKAFDVNKLKKDIDIILRKYGHKPKYKKMKYYTKGKATPITGTIVTSDHKLKVPNNLQHKIYCGFQELKVLHSKSLDLNEEKKVQSLKGQIQAAKSIENRKFLEISRLINKF